MGQCFFGTEAEALAEAERLRVEQGGEPVVSGPFDTEGGCNAFCTTTGTGSGTSGIPPTLPPGSCGHCEVPATLFAAAPLAPVSDGDCSNCEDLVQPIQMRQIPSSSGPGTCQWVSIIIVLDCDPYLFHLTLIFFENGADDFWLLGTVQPDFVTGFQPLYFARDDDFVCGGVTAFTLINENSFCAWPPTFHVWH